MTASQIDVDQKQLQSTIFKWLNQRLQPEAYKKLETTFHRLSGDAEDWEVFSSFSGVPRTTGKESLDLTDEEKKQAEEIRPGWQPEHWNIDQLGRTLLILALAKRGKPEFMDKLEKIFISSDMSEAIALYQSLPVLPWPESLTGRAAEGIRSNITSVFNAVALRNPYPADYFDEDAWNQVVLKALFVESPLFLIYGLDRRANKKLAGMLVEYAHERWSAGRVVSPELWRPVGSFIDEEWLDEIKKVLENPDDIQKQAAILAMSSSKNPPAKELLKKIRSGSPETVTGSENVTWDEIGRRWNEVES